MDTHLRSFSSGAIFTYMKPIDSLYIHFPFCKHLCNYCDFFKNKLESESQIKDFESLLEKQITFHESFLTDSGFKLASLDTLYIGGGTPSLWGKKAKDFLLDRFKLNSDCEFTIEVDPDSWSEEDIDSWLELGVNRFSIGAQAYSNDYIKIMDRTHRVENVEKTIKYFSERGLNFTVDLMLGLPDISKRNLKSELDGLLKYRPNHFSVYILKTRKNYPHNQKLPSDEIIREEYLFVSKYLQESGYNHYEVSNFSRDGFESRHNKKYWNYKSVAAIGPNATGLLVEEDKAIRYQWKSSSPNVTIENLDGESLMIEKLFLGLRHKNNFNFKTVFKNKSQLSEITKLLISWSDKGFIEKKSTIDSVNLTALGYLMCDSLLDEIFREVEF